MPEQTIQWITSVGIDIGTTTTQLVISRLTIENTASGTFVPRMEITEKRQKGKMPKQLLRLWPDLRETL